MTHPRIPIGHFDVDAARPVGESASMAPRITTLRAHDIRFPTSDGLHGSDAMNPDPDYSAAVAVLETDEDGLSGHGLTFTIGRGNEICVAAIRAYERHVVGRDLDEIEADMGAFWRSLAGDSQLRWIGPDKGAIHLATGAVVNAMWDFADTFSLVVAFIKKTGYPEMPVKVRLKFLYLYSKVNG